jgi:hypothetical protein
MPVLSLRRVRERDRGSCDRDHSRSRDRHFSYCRAHLILQNNIALVIQWAPGKLVPWN